MSDEIIKYKTKHWLSRRLKEISNLIIRNEIVSPKAIASMLEDLINQYKNK